MNRRTHLFTLVFAGTLLALAVALCGTVVSPASAYTQREQTAIRFVGTHTSTAMRIANTASAAATAGGNGNWTHATALCHQATRQFVALAHQWLALPTAGGHTGRLEYKYGSFLEDVRVYLLCVARVQAGDSSYSTCASGIGAWDRASSDCVQVIVELHRLGWRG